MMVILDVRDGNGPFSTWIHIDTLDFVKSLPPCATIIRCR